MQIQTFSLLSKVASPLKALVASAGLLASTAALAATWDINEDAFDAAQGGVQVKGQISANEDPDVQLSAYACRGCQNADPFIFLYLPAGHSSDEAYTITVNGRRIIVQSESGDDPEHATDQVPVDINDVSWWAQQVIHDVPLTVTMDNHVWHFANTNGHRFAR